MVMFFTYMFAQGRDSGNPIPPVCKNRLDDTTEIVTAGAERGPILLRNVLNM